MGSEVHRETHVRKSRTFCFLRLQLSQACAVRCLWSAADDVSAFSPRRAANAASHLVELWAESSLARCESCRSCREGHVCESSGIRWSEDAQVWDSL